MTTEFKIGGDLPVRRMGFGALRLTGPHGWGPPADPPAAAAVLRRAVELGVDLIDTADSYGLGTNEELIAAALHPYRDGLVIATKAGQSRPGPREWVPLGRPEYLRQQAELSLRRLRVERIDLFQLHRVDPLVPLADQIGALKQLRDEGKVRHIGLSEVSVAQLDEARRTAPIASVQNLYNVAQRGHDDVLDYCAGHGIAFLPWLPVGGGSAGAGPALRKVARDLGATPTQVALAWLLRRSEVMIPIPGTASVEHLAENVAAADLCLSDEQYRVVSEDPAGR
jgi:pyridoxine 4-dehydrogenase